MGNLLRSCNHPNLIDGANLRTQTTMNAKNLSIDNGGEYEEVKYMAACLPNGCIAVFLLAFFIEAVHLGNLPRLVVAADEHNLVWVPFEGNKPKKET